jgi:hypothetical protein
MMFGSSFLKKLIRVVLTILFQDMRHLFGKSES